MPVLDLKKEFVAFFHADRTPVYGQYGELYSPTGQSLGTTERHIQEANQRRYAITTQCRRYIVQASERSEIEAKLAELQAKFEQEREEKLELLNEKLRQIEQAGEIIEDIPDIEDKPEAIEPLQLTDIEKQTLGKIANLRKLKLPAKPLTSMPNN